MTSIFTTSFQELPTHYSNNSVERGPTTPESTFAFRILGLTNYYKEDQPLALKNRILNK